MEISFCPPLLLAPLNPITALSGERPRMSEGSTP
jgi:hypothetical protein